MNKKLTAVALAAGLLLLAGCSAQSTTAFRANWQSNTAVYDVDFSETLRYSVSFERDENFAGGFVFEPGEGCEFTVTTTAIPSWNGMTHLYRLTSSLTLEGTYLYVDPDTKAESELVSFGGDSGNQPAVIERRVLFYSPYEDNLEPIRSENTVYSYTPVQRNGSAVEVYSYSYRVDYENGGNEASVTYTDGFADVRAEESAINENTRKVSVFAEGMLPEETVSVGGIQSRYSGIDEGQLLFAGRGITYSSEGAVPLTVVSGASVYDVSLRGVTATLSVAGQTGFVLNGEAVEDEAVEAVVVSAQLAGGGAESGPLQTVSYALPDQTDADGNSLGNLYFALPLEIRQAFGFSGTAAQIVYTLRDVSRPLPTAE